MVASKTLVVYTCLVIGRNVDRVSNTLEPESLGVFTGFKLFAYGAMVSIGRIRVKHMPSGIKTGEELCYNGKLTRHDAHVTHNGWFPALSR